MFFSVLSNFIFYFICLGMALYTKESCYLPLAILLSFQQLFNIFIGFGVYFQHKNFNFLEAWPLLQIYQFALLICIGLGWVLCLRAYREYKAVKYGWSVGEGQTNPSSMGYGTVARDEENGV